MDPVSPSGQRTIRAPGTIIKPPTKISNYPNAYLTQKQFRIINPAGSSTITRPSQNPPQQQQQSPRGTNVPGTSSAISTTTATTNGTRLLGKPSGLVRPTPIKQISSGLPSTTLISGLLKPAQSRLPAFGSNSRLATLRQSTTSLATKTATTVDKPKALIRAKFSPPSQNQAQNNLNYQHQLQATTAATSITTSKQPATSTSNSSSSINKLSYGVDISAIETDVGQIRVLLEQLLTLLKASNDNQESLAQENQRLRSEVLELKGKIRAIRSTVAANRDSEVQFRSGGDEGFRGDLHRAAIFSANSKERPSGSLSATNNNNNNADNRPDSSIYLSPMS